jgi:predicted RNA binding protein YcfA (HicA-like mRNA interferase family)
MGLASFYFPAFCDIDPVPDAIHAYNNHHMNSREIIKRLESDGWVLVRVKGSHHQFRRPGMAGLVTVVHPLRDIPPGTLRSIYRQAGWTWP